MCTVCMFFVVFAGPLWVSQLMSSFLITYVAYPMNIHCHYSWYIPENCDPSYELSTLGGDC